MGILSDRDVNNAAKAALKDLKTKHPEINMQDWKMITLEFLGEFEEILKYFRKTPTPVFDVNSVQLSRGLVNDPKGFGFAFGSLVGIFKFRPEQVVKERRVESIISCVNALNDKPPYRKMIAEIIEIWKVEVQEPLKLFENSYLGRYEQLLQGIGQT